MKKRWLLIGLLIGVALASFYWGRYYFPQQEVLEHFFAQFPLGFSIMIFIAIYIASAFLIFDIKDILKIVAAFVFGLWLSCVLILIAELLSCILLFHLARYWGQDWVMKKIRVSEQKLHWIQSLTSLRNIFFLRFLPIIPYRILDMAYGMTSIAFPKYFLMVGFASPFRIFWLQWMIIVFGGMLFYPEKMMLVMEENPLLLGVNALYMLSTVIGLIVIIKSFFQKNDSK